MKRFLLCLLVASLFLSAFLIWSEKKVHSNVPKPRPHIFFFMVDTLRADYLGTYGFQGDISPTVDDLAKESIVFEKCISQSPWTKPAVASLFTSLHPQSHRVVDHLGMHWKKTGEGYKTSVLSDQAVTLAEILQSDGYETYGFIGNDFLIRKFGYGQGFDHYFEPKPHSDIFSATSLFRKARRILKKRKSEKPMFMYFHFMDVHGPYQCSGKDFGVMRKSPSLGKPIKLSKEQRRSIPNELGRKISWRGSSKALEVTNWRACYAAGIRKFDRRFDYFISILKKMNLYDNSIIVFTSDHGEELFDHQGWAHSHTLYTELLSIPLIIRLPQARLAGTKVPESVNLVDLMPTLIKQAGVKGSLEGIVGQDLSPLLVGERIKGLGWAYATATRHEPGMISVQNNQYKLVWNRPKKTPELYDVRNDPWEKKDIAKTKPKVVRRLQQRVNKHIFDLEKQGNLVDSTVPLSGPLVEKLKSLGYLQ